jgi:hypothetical protein
MSSQFVLLTIELSDNIYRRFTFNQVFYMIEMAKHVADVQEVAYPVGSKAAPESPSRHG